MTENSKFALAVLAYNSFIWCSVYLICWRLSISKKIINKYCCFSFVSNVILLVACYFKAKVLFLYLLTLAVFWPFLLMCYAVRPYIPRKNKSNTLPKRSVVLWKRKFYVRDIIVFLYVVFFSLLGLWAVILFGEIPEPI